MQHIAINYNVAFSQKYIAAFSQKYSAAQTHPEPKIAMQPMAENYIVTFSQKYIAAFSQKIQCSMKLPLATDLSDELLLNMPCTK